jgi:hypothetical protein
MFQCHYNKFQNIFLIKAQIEKNGIDFVRRKLNLSKLWPVMNNEGTWNASLWNASDFHRFSVDFFIDADLKNTSRRILYVRNDVA